MILNLRIATASFVLLFATGSALAAPAENAPASSSGASGVALKVENSVKRGAKATGNALERAGKATTRGVNKAARKVGLPAQSNTPASTRTTEPG